MAAEVGELVETSADARWVFNISITDATRHINGIKMGSEVNVDAEAEGLWDGPSFSG